MQIFIQIISIKWSTQALCVIMAYEIVWCRTTGKKRLLLWNDNSELFATFHKLFMGDPPQKFLILYGLCKKKRKTYAVMGNSCFWSTEIWKIFSSQMICNLVQMMYIRLSTKINNSSWSGKNMAVIDNLYFWLSEIK